MDNEETIYDAETEALLARFVVVGEAAEAEGWLGLLPMVRASIATARRGGRTNVCFDLAKAERVVEDTLAEVERRAKLVGRPASAAELDQLRGWRDELHAVRVALTALVQAEIRAGAAAQAAKLAASRRYG